MNNINENKIYFNIPMQDDGMTMSFDEVIAKIILPNKYLDIRQLLNIESFEHNNFRFRSDDECLSIGQLLDIIYFSPKSKCDFVCKIYGQTKPISFTYIYSGTMNNMEEILNSMRDVHLTLKMIGQANDRGDYMTRLKDRLEADYLLEFMGEETHPANLLNKENPMYRNMGLK